MELTNYNAILEIVKFRTADLKKHFMESVKQNAEARFAKLPSIIEALREEDKMIGDQIGEVFDAKLGILKQTEAVGKLHKRRETVRREIKAAGKWLALGHDAYVEREITDAENAFDGKVEGLALKLNSKGFAADGLKFEAICHDPKLFDAVIASDGKTVHARSIWAAENSELVAPHFRFIVTNAR